MELEQTVDMLQNSEKIRGTIDNIYPVLFDELAFHFTKKKTECKTLQTANVPKKKTTTEEQVRAAVHARAVSRPVNMRWATGGERRRSDRLLTKKGGKFLANF